MVTTIRPKDEPAATSVAAGDIFLIDGTTGVRGLAATQVAIRDANGNVTVNNVLEGYTTTATAAGTTTLTASSTRQQFFTGVTTQIITMPVTSTLTLGQSWTFQNTSTGALTINSSGGNLIATVAAGASATIKCILITGTTAASWQTVYAAVLVSTGKVLTVSNSLTLAGTDGTTQTFPSTSGTVVTSVSVNAVTNAMAAQMGAFTLKMNATSGTANATDTAIGSLTHKVSPATTDLLLISDQAAAGALKYSTLAEAIGALASGVSSIATLTGAFTLSNGLTNVGNDIRLDIGNLPGISGSGAAAAGKVGEVIDIEVLIGSAVLAASATPTTIMSISLTAGDWQVWGNMYTNLGGTISNIEAGISQTTNTMPTRPGKGMMSLTNFGSAISGNQGLPIAGGVIRLSATTTVYLVGSVTGTVSIGLYGYLGARRMR